MSPPEICAAEERSIAHAVVAGAMLAGTTGLLVSALRALFQTCG